MSKRKTAGELSLKAGSDSHVYDPLEVSHAICGDIIEQAYICAQRESPKFDEEEFTVVMVFANDPLIKCVKRKKFYGYLYLPSPRPEQVVFLYNKITGKMKRLWSLPNAAVMAKISETPWVSKPWRQTKGWVDAFYDGKFWEHIRKEHNINMLSEIEFLKANREKLIQAGAKECPTDFSDPFDFSKITVDHIEDTKTARAQ